MKNFIAIILVSLLIACNNTATVEPTNKDHTENKDTMPVPKDSLDAKQDSARS